MRLWNGLHVFDYVPPAAFQRAEVRPCRYFKLVVSLPLDFQPA